MGDAPTILSRASAITTTIQDFELGRSVIRDTIPARREPKATPQIFVVKRRDYRLRTIQQAPLFRDLSASEFGEVASAGQERIFSEGQKIFGEGDPLCWVSMVTSGHAKIIRHSAAGKPLILRLCGRGDVLDGLGATAGSTHSLEAQALRGCRIFTWETKRFESLSKRFPVLSRNAMLLLLARLRLMEARLHELATERVPQRLAKTLLRLIVQARGSGRTSSLNLRGEELAQIVGTTQFTVSRLLCEWAEQRIIQAEESALIVQNIPGLIAIAMQVECGTEPI